MIFRSKIYTYSKTPNICRNNISNGSNHLGSNQIPTLTTKRSCAATPSINALNRVGCPRAPHRRRSNPHRARCTIASHFPRFRPLEGFVRRPPECLAPSVRGRHPKPFTKALMDLAHVNWLYVAIQVPIYIAFFMIGGLLTPPLQKKRTWRGVRPID